MPSYLSASKINLHLEVDPPQSDGFHPLRTVFLSLDLWEKLHFEPQGGEFTLAVKARPGIDPGPLEENLVLKAAQLACQAWGLSGRGGTFRLEKSIPSGSGLGSGSANAAAALWALRDAYCPSKTSADLVELASRLGADCAFFVAGGCAFGEGRGERLTPLPEPQFPALILRGERPQGTASAYQALDALRALAVELPEASGLNDAPAAKEWLQQFWQDPPSSIRNDFEAVLAQDLPEITTYQDVLRREGAFLVGLAGSGSAVFGLFPDPVQRDRAAQAILLDSELEPAPPWVLAAKTGGPGVRAQEGSPA